jgi:multidrug efflux pump subunit AcrA (membrane-fusion protein)
MPSRRGRNKQQPEDPDPIVRFAAALKKTEERDKADKQRIKAEREEAAKQARLAAEHAEAIRVATHELDAAIAAAKSARSSGKGVAEADLAWRRAKARMIELETGQRPDWGID